MSRRKKTAQATEEQTRAIPTDPTWETGEMMADDLDGQGSAIETVFFRLWMIHEFQNQPINSNKINGHAYEPRKNRYIAVPA